ncbi:MAG: pyridoxamine 5'-phosphate oxidase family protein [Pseudomonadota bacterium]
MKGANMGITTTELKPSFRDFIEAQPVFFVATAAPEGRVNVSPKGLDSLKIVSNNQIVWLNVTGSGNETAAHVLENPRMTLMFCSFDEKPLTLRVYGTAEVYYPRHSEWKELYAQFPDYAGARNIFRLNIDLVTTSCGSGVPCMSSITPRAETELLPFYEEMSDEQIAAYWQKKNEESIDGKSTGIFADPI